MINELQSISDLCDTGVIFSSLQIVMVQSLDYSSREDSKDIRRIEKLLVAIQKKLKKPRNNFLALIGNREANFSYYVYASFGLLGLFGVLRLLIVFVGKYAAISNTENILIILESISIIGLFANLIFFVVILPVLFKKRNQVKKLLMATKEELELSHTTEWVEGWSDEQVKRIFSNLSK